MVNTNGARWHPHSATFAEKSDTRFQIERTIFSGQKRGENSDCTIIVTPRMVTFALFLLHSDTNALMQLLYKHCSKRNHQCIFQWIVNEFHKSDAFISKCKLNRVNTLTTRMKFSMLLPLLFQNQLMRPQKRWWLLTHCIHNWALDDKHKGKELQQFDFAVLHGPLLHSIFVLGANILDSI